MPECMGATIVPFMGIAQHGDLVARASPTPTRASISTSTARTDNKLAPLGVARQRPRSRCRSPRSTTSSCRSRCSATTASRLDLHQVRLLRRPVQPGPRRRRQGHHLDDRGAATASTPTRASTRARPRIPTNRVDDDCDGYRRQHDRGLEAHRHHGPRRRRLLAGAGRLRRPRRRRRTWRWPSRATRAPWTSATTASIRTATASPTTIRPAIRSRHNDVTVDRAVGLVRRQR